ncbi:M23 family metallopeptidase [Paraburkholderia sp. BCC1886]|uniref:M23 family metallopeptidase n=1 Tax=Paraburkholderia sp. BCC1886 TaxID=2562670 RepID=UPI001181F4DA|nr:M23 family metallopeptidase [Paraburkholderia sp. BCC1886]
MSAGIHLGTRLSSGSIGFVERRTALTVAFGAASAAALLALAAGVSIGMHWSSKHDATPATGQSATDRVEHDYQIDQLGKLNASVAQIEPRLARLASQLGALTDFDARLNGPRPASRATQRAARPAGALAASSALTPSGEPFAADSEGEGGPALPPRRCNELIPPAEGAGRTYAGRTDAGRADAGRTYAGRTDAGRTDAGRADAGRAEAGRTDPQRTQRELACIAATLSALEHGTAAHALAYAAFPGRMPADGARFGSPFGNRTDPFTQRLSFHPGIDLVARTGTPILAAAGGRVIFAGEKSGYGTAVEIDHGNGLVTRYGHASRLEVHAGEVVLPRQHIADVGSTGRSTGPHLHFEVLVNGSPADPAAYLALFAPASHG